MADSSIRIQLNFQENSQINDEVFRNLTEEELLPKQSLFLNSTERRNSSAQPSKFDALKANFISSGAQFR